MKFLRLAFICTEKNPVPPIVGGAIQILIDGVTPYISKKHDLTIFSITHSALPLSNYSQGVQYIRFPRENYIASVIEYLRNNPPFDVIHVFNRPRHIYSYKQASPRSRFVLSLHNEMFHRKKIPYGLAINCINKVETIMTVSDYISGTVSKRFPKARRKLKTVYSGADVNHFRPIWTENNKRITLRKKFDINDKKVILFTGRLSVKKGPHILIKAFELILPKHPDTVLFIVGGRQFGDSSLDAYVSELYNLSTPVSDKVIFTGHVSPKDIPDHYTIGDIFVCSSQWQEPLARVHYEAMAAGLPIITTNRGGNAEVIHNHKNGIVINDYSNPAAFAQALDPLLTYPKLSSILGRQGRKMAEERFSFKRVADDLEKIYLSALY